MDDSEVLEERRDRSEKLAVVLCSTCLLIEKTSESNCRSMNTLAERRQRVTAAASSANGTVPQCASLSANASGPGPSATASETVPVSHWQTVEVIRVTSEIGSTRTIDAALAVYHYTAAALQTLHFIMLNNTKFLNCQWSVPAAWQAEPAPVPARCTPGTGITPSRPGTVQPHVPREWLLKHPGR